MATTAKASERDHIDAFLETIRDVLPMLDPEVEGLVDRIGGLSRRFSRFLDETLAEFKLDHAEWKLLGLLARRVDGHSSSPGKLARPMELQSGNVVLSAKSKPEQTARKVERVIAERFGLDVPVVVRTKAELTRVVKKNPLAKVARDPKRYQVSFLVKKLDAPKVRKLEAAVA